MSKARLELLAPAAAIREILGPQARPEPQETLELLGQPVKLEPQAKQELLEQLVRPEPLARQLTLGLRVKQGLPE